MKKYTVLIFVLVVISAGIYFGIKKSKEVSIQKKTRYILDTYCTIQIPGDEKMLSIIDKAFDRVEEINKKFNILNPESPLYDFNNKNVPIADKEIIDLIKVSLEAAEKSDGAFDITVYPLVKLWGFFEKSANQDVPKQKYIDESLKKVGYKNLVIKDNKLIKLKNYVGVDLGAIAKGYAVGEAMKVLKNAGIKSAIIDLGSDIYALGTLNGKPWRIGIKNPRGEGVIGALEMTDLSVATSGDYERFFEKNGVRYCHILDPKTGYPAREIISATVITADATMADALSTAVFVLGKDKGLALIEKIPKTEVVIVTSKGEVVCSSGLKDMLEVVKKGGGKNEK